MKEFTFRYKTLNENKCLLWTYDPVYISKAKTSSFENISLNDHSAEILCVICVSVVKFLK